MSQRSRTDLCGGCRATGIPTATHQPISPISPVTVPISPHQPNILHLI